MLRVLRIIRTAIEETAMSEAKSKSTDLKVQRTSTPAASSPWAPGMQGWHALREEMERLFDRFTAPFLPSLGGRRGFAVEPFRHFQTSFGFSAPAVDVIETDKGYRIKAELPGLDEKDVDVSLSGDTLTIKGEKSESKEEKEGDYHLSERRYGSFQRSFYVPEGVDRDNISAKFEKGVLVIELPRSAEATQQRKKIEIKK
jgi:HSP20 family protein